MESVLIWRRLLWKEMRESVLILVLFALTPLMISTFGRAKGYTIQHSLPSILMFLLISIWAVNKAKSAAKGRAFLPLSASRELAASFFFPLAISFMVGGWFGILVSTLLLHNLSPQMIIISELLAASIFAIIYTMSAAFTPTLCILISLILAFIVGQAYSQLVNYWSYPAYSWLLKTTLSCLAGSVAAVLIYRNISQWRPGLPAKSLNVILALILPLCYSGVILYNLESQNKVSNYQYYMPLNEIISADGSMQISCPSRNNSLKRQLIFENFKTGASITRKFDSAIAVLGIAGNGKAFLAQQKPGERSASVLAWTLASNNVMKVMSIPIMCDGIVRNLLNTNAVTPDGRYAFLSTQSGIGRGYDLWLLDLEKGRYRLLAVSKYYGRGRIEFIGNRAYVSGDDAAMVVDLERMEASPLLISDFAGGDSK